MPTYEFLNNDTGEFEEHFMSYKDLDEFKENNPHLKQQVSAPNIVGGTGDRVKTDSGFKEVLSKAAEAHPNSPLAERYGRKTVRQTQVEAARKKHTNRILKGGGR